MAHYTGHTFTLTELNTIEQQKSDFLDSLNIKLASPDLLVKDMALMLKSLEVMENLEHLPEYKTFILNVAQRSAQFVNPTELITNGGFDVTYNTANLVQNSDFGTDAFEVELVKNSGFDTPVDLARPWANGIAYLFDIFTTEGTKVIRAYSDGLQTAVAWFETQLKPNTQYKFAYDLDVAAVNWDLSSGGFNMVDIPSVDETIFSETGGGPVAQTIVISIIEDGDLVLPTCDGTIVPWDDTVDYNLALAAMEATCKANDAVWNWSPPNSAFYCDVGAGYPGDGSATEAICYANNAVWDEGALTDPLTQEHTIVPYHVEAREGDTLVFTNPVGNYLVHNAVSDDNISFASPDLNPGDVWNWVVDGYHDVYFHCTFHPLEEGRMTTKTNHRYVYNVDHGLNPGDTVKIPINYGSMVALPSLSTSYFINLLLPNQMETTGGAPYTSVESLYHDLSISNVVTMQSGAVETNPNAGVPMTVAFTGGVDANTIPATAEAIVAAGTVSQLNLTANGQNYTTAPTIYITGGGGAGATGTLEFNGSVTSATVSDAGAGYGSVPTVQISAPDVARLGPASFCTDPAYTTQSSCVAATETWYEEIPTVQAEATVSLSGSALDQISMTNVGSGYHSPPTITFLGGSPTVAGAATSEIDGTIYSVTLTAGGSGYGSGDGSVPVGERQWEEYLITAVAKGDERVDVFFDDANAIGHVHTATITPAEWVLIQGSTATMIVTDTDDTGHTHTATFDWDAALNNGAGGMYLVGMTGGHTHGIDEYFELTGGTKVELVNFGHYHEILISEVDEATLKASVLTGTSQDPDGTWSATGGATLIRTSDHGTSDPQHFHTVEFGCLDAANDIYLIIEIDQHIHDMGRVWYPGSNQFTVGKYDFAAGGDDLNPSSIALAFADLNGYVKKEKGIESDSHGLIPGDRVHFENVYNGIHHGNTNYYVDYVVDADNFVLTETVVYPLGSAAGTTPTVHNVIEEYTVTADLASYRFQVERDITNHVGDATAGTGVQIEWSRPTTVKSVGHGLTVGDIVQLPSGAQPYTPSELPGAFVDHTVTALGDGYGPTDNMEITVDTNTTVTWADPNITTVEGAQDSPWLWSWWDHSAASYYPYQIAGATHDNFGGNDGTNGGFDLYRGGTYKFINNAWSPSGHITLVDPVTGLDQPLYMHAAGIKAILGAGWDNLVTAGFADNDGNNCVSMRANHGLTITAGDHNDFVNLEEEPGTWVGPEVFPECTALAGWCEEIDVGGWYYNGEDDEATCLALNPTEDPGLAQWRGPQFIGNFAKEFTWHVPEDFGLTGSDGNSGYGPFNAPGQYNGAYHVTHDGGLYRFDKSGMIEGTNRTINLYRGGTYRFKINSAGHPIYITTDDGSHFTPGAYFGEYLLGVQNSRAEEGPGVQSEGPAEDLWGYDDSGVAKYEILEWTVPEVSPNTMYYQCGWHASMMGTFNILDLPVVNAGENVVVYFHHGQDNMYTPLHIRDKILVDNGTSDDYFQVLPIPANPFPVPGTQADLLGTNNALTATGPGDIPYIQAMNIELGTVSYIDPLQMIPGIGSEQFLVTNSVGGLAKVYFSVDVDKRSDITLDNVTFKEVVWTETGSWSVSGGTAHNETTDAAYIEQIVSGSLTAGTTYEVQYDIIESFKDNYGAENGSITTELRGDTVVSGTANTLVGHYTETLTAPVNTTLLRLVNTGRGKIDNVSIRERVTGQNAWSIGEGWNTDAAKAYINGSIASSTEVSQTLAIDTGKLYEVKYLLGNVDDDNNGMTGRMRVALGTNPNQLISNWNFDIADPALVNWVNSDSSVSINGERLYFNSSVDGTSTYTLSNALVNGVKYEVTFDTDLLTENILNFTAGPGPTGTHSHTFQMTEAQGLWLQESTNNSLTVTQTDGYHAETYTHDFTVKWLNIGGTDQYTITEQTNPEGHDELVLVSTTINNPTVDFVINGVTLGTVSTSGIHHIDFIGLASNTLILKLNGTGAVNSIKLVEETIPIIDYNTTGLNQDGEKVYHVRAGSHDQKIHFIGEVDDNPAEENNPYYSNVGFEGSIDDVSVREIIENWTFAPQEGGVAYVDQNTKQIYTSGAGPDARGIAHITFEMEDEMSYKVALKVDRPTDSVLKLGPTPDSDTYGSLLIEDTLTGGVYDEARDFTFKATVSGTCYLTLSTTGTGFTYWDDISVKTIPKLSSDEYLLLARSMNVMGVPIGGEDRWNANHHDNENLDYVGQPIAGMRTMESFGESVIEDYYDVNRRGNEILNPPITLISTDVTTGHRSVAEIVPSCTTNFGTETYTIETQCETIVGVWTPTVVAHCSNVNYPLQVDCETDFGWWTQPTLGSCSNALYSSEYGCLGAGTCSNVTYSFEYTCIAAGTCSDPVYNDNELGCIDSGGSCSDGSSQTSGACYESDGTCTDGTSTNRTDCLNASGTWTPTHTWTPVNTWTNAGHTWTSAGHTWTPGLPGYCSDGVQTTEEACEGPRGTWIPTVNEYCTTDIAFLTVNNQGDCESPRGSWDATVVDSIDGQWVEILGDGIDFNYTIELGGVAQPVYQAINLPYKVKFMVAPTTPLGAQVLSVTNSDGDTASFVDNDFTVTDRLRIITVVDINTITGAGFVTADTVVEFISTGTTTIVDTPAVTVVDANNITVAPTLTAGNYDVRVTNLDGQTFTEVNCLTV